MKKALYIFWQYLWGLPQNLVGAVLYLYYRLKGCPHFSYQGARVILWTVDAGSMSVGRYLFLHQSWRPKDQFLLAHEYGHTIQSLILGPLYLPLVGLPSILWAGLPCFERLRRKSAAPTTPSTRRTGRPASASDSPERPPSVPRS